MYTELSTSLIRIAACLLVLLSAALMLPGPARAAYTDAVESDSESFLALTLGKAEIVSVSDGVADIMIADPSIADVVALQNDKLYIVGSSLGDTNIIALDKAGNVLKRLTVTVKVDTDAIEKMVKDVFPNEGAVQVRTVGDQVVLTGTVSTPIVSQKIARLVAAHIGEVQDKDFETIDEAIENMLEVRGEQQVMLRVKIIEISRSVLKELGLETQANDPNDDGSIIFRRFERSQRNGLEGGLLSDSQTGLTQDPIAAAGLLLDTGINGLGLLELNLSALEQSNLATVLAQPNLTAVSGEQAGFLAGGEFPIPVGRDRDGNIVVDYKKFGVSLNFRPIVMSEDRISLQLNTEVSSLDFGEGLTLADVQVPGLDVRRASTTVEINSGGSLMMAGLLKAENTKGMSGLPGIRNTPILGDLISSRSFGREETELLVIVTPYLVKPFGDNTQAAARINPPEPAPVTTAQDKLMMQDKGKVAFADVTPETEPTGLLDRPQAALTKVFGDNLRQIYGDRVRDLPDAKQNYGYMME